MSNMQRFDNLVLGSGESGKYLAWTLAKAGQRSAVVERGLIGGSCPNIAGRAFPDAADFAAAKIGVFLASLLAGVLGAAILWPRRAEGSGSPEADRSGAGVDAR